MSGHILGWVTLDRLLAVAGIAFTWLVSRYFYTRSDKKRIPTFILQSTKVLAEPELSHISGLSAICNGIDIAKSGVVKAKIYFWNSGTLPILKSEVQEPYAITLPGPILYDLVTKLNREVTELVSMPDANSPNVLTLNFAVLEPGDGGTIEVVYAGPVKTIEFKGACLESHRPTILPPNPIYTIPVSKRIRNDYAGLGQVVLMVGGFASAIIAVFWGVKHFWGDRGANILGTALMLVFVTGVLLAVMGNLWGYIKRMTSPYLPPDVKD
jgi:hypothetical protein